MGFINSYFPQSLKTRAKAVPIQNGFGLNYFCYNRIRVNSSRDLYVRIKGAYVPINKLMYDKKTIINVSKIDPTVETAIELNDSSLKDEDLTRFIELLPKNNDITEIYISNHSLTAESYSNFITILKTHPTVTSFWVKPIRPLSACASEYYAAMGRLIKKNQELASSKKEKLELKALLVADKPQTVNNALTAAASHPSQGGVITQISLPLQASTHPLGSLPKTFIASATVAVTNPHSTSTQTPPLIFAKVSEGSMNKTPPQVVRVVNMTKSFAIVSTH